MIISRFFQNTPWTPWKVYVDFAQTQTLADIVSWDITEVPGPSYQLTINGTPVNELFQSRPEALGALWGWWALYNNDFDPANFEAAIGDPVTPINTFAGWLSFVDEDIQGQTITGQLVNWDLSITHPVSEEPLTRIVQQGADLMWTVLATGTTSDVLTYVLQAGDVGKPRRYEVVAPHYATFRVQHTPDLTDISQLKMTISGSNVAGYPVTVGGYSYAVPDESGVVLDPGEGITYDHVWYREIPTLTGLNAQIIPE